MPDIPHQDNSLTIWNGQVQLPAGSPLRPGSAEMAEVLRTALPGDTALAVIAAQEASRRGISHWERAWILAGLAVTAIAVWLLWPAPFHVVAERSGGPSQVGSASFRVAGQYAELFRQADKLFGKERYKECVALMDTALPEVMENAESFLANRKFVYLYLNACYKANDSRQICVEHIRRAQEYAPDDLTWAMGAIVLEWMPFEKCFGDYERLIAGIAGKPRERAVRRKHQFEMLCGRLETLLADNAKRDDSALTGQQLREMRLRYCQLLTALWLLKGHPHYPDDAGDPGVEERETAYCIATTYGDDLHFLLVRKAVVQTIAEHLSWHDGYYFFDGAKRFKRDYLADALEDIDLKLSTIPRGGISP